MAVPPRRAPHLLTPARLLVLWLCLWGGLLQSTIGQTHVHAAVARASAAATMEMAPLAPADAGCLLCEIAGHSPVLASAPAPLALVDAPAVGGDAAIPSAARLPSHPRHHWHGRAPPVLA